MAERTYFTSAGAFTCSPKPFPTCVGCNISSQEFKQSIGLEETRVVLACRGHVWRARDTSAGSPGQRRLLSEMTVPPSVQQASSTSGSADIPVAASSNEEEVAGNGYRWEVLACAGFPLPKAFDVVSSLGGLGRFGLSRYENREV